MTDFNYNIEYLKRTFGIKFIGDKVSNYQQDCESDGDKIIFQVLK